LSIVSWERAFSKETLMHIRFFLLVTFLLSICQIIYAQEGVATPTVQRSDTIPFELTEHNNISIQAVVNGTDTVKLMFHTAANDVSLIKSSADKTTSVDWDNSSDVQSWGGESEARYSSSNTLHIGASTWNGLSIW